jgi:hypothetical protein
MINLFRKLRQSLIGQNKTAKYVTYAFGEIVLVVVGILIALSINNWNEQRKIRIAEQEILKNLRTELSYNKQELTLTLNKHKKALEDGIALLNLFGKDISDIPVQQLDALLGNTEIVWTYESRDGYINSIISSGNINFIKSEELKSLLSSFDGEVTNAIQEIKQIERLLNERLWPVIDGKINGANRIRKVFKMSPIPEGTYPSDYQWFLKNREVEDIISNIQSWWISIIADEKRLLVVLDRMLVIIDQEIKQS